MKEAKLARIELTKTEESRFTNDFDDILEWAKQLEELETIEMEERKNKSQTRGDRATGFAYTFPFSEKFITARKAL